MFLYARIVIDNVVDLTSLNSIRRELRALPEDLDAAYVPDAMPTYLWKAPSNLVSRYGRVLSRINGLPSRIRDKVKRILGWIGCSPTPLNQYELEQALHMSANIGDDAPTIDSSLNIAKLCGSIVEVIEETPQFVHFTVKE